MQTEFIPLSAASSDNVSALIEFENKLKIKTNGNAINIFMVQD